MSDSGVLTKSNLKNLNNSNAIFLTRNDVIRLRLEKISNWPEKNQLIALKYGIPSLSISNLLTNTWINSIFRKNFNLKYGGSYGAFLSSVLLTGIFPTAANGALINFYYTEFLFYTRPSECLICREIKAIGLHIMIGSIIPTLMAWNTNYFQASIYKSYSIPDSKWLADKSLRRKYWYFFKQVFRNTTKNCSNKIFLAYSIQLILSSAVFFFQQKEYYDYIEPQSFHLSEIKKIKVV